MSTKPEELKKRIQEEMTVDYANSLEKHFDLAKQFLRVTKDGKIDVIIKDKIGGKEQVQTQLFILETQE